MSLIPRIVVADESALVDAVLGTRLGRRYYLLRLDGLPVQDHVLKPDPRALWAFWCVKNAQFKPIADARVGHLNLSTASKFRRWLWIWTGR